MMNNSNLYDNGWLDIVFNNRNKNYGAYVLRMQSSAIVFKAFIFTVPLFILFFIGPVIYRYLFPLPVTDNRVAQVEVILKNPVHELKKEQPEPEAIKKEKPKAAPLRQPIKTTNFSSSIVVVDKEVADPPTTAELQQSVIGSMNTDGAASTGNVLSEGSETGGTGMAAEGGGNGNEIYTAAGVEVYPEFPGGMAAWAKFIQRNLKYPYAAQENAIQGKVYLSFVVEKDGSITDVNVIRGIGYGCDEEALRVIKKSPRWKPGTQNNQAVRVRYTMPIGYIIQ